MSSCRLTFTVAELTWRKHLFFPQLFCCCCCFCAFCRIVLWQSVETQSIETKATPSCCFCCLFPVDHMSYTCYLKIWFICFGCSRCWIAAAYLPGCLALALVWPSPSAIMNKWDLFNIIWSSCAREVKEKFHLYRYSLWNGWLALPAIPVGKNCIKPAHLQSKPPRLIQQTKENLKLDCHFLFAQRDWECQAGVYGYAGHLVNGGREIVCRRQKPLASLGISYRVTKTLRSNLNVLGIPCFIF